MPILPDKTSANHQVEGAGDKNSDSALKQGVSSMLKHQDLTDSAFEDKGPSVSGIDDSHITDHPGGTNNPGERNAEASMRDHHGGMNPLKAFTSKGSVGKEFQPTGAAGSVPQKIGGPFDQEGIVGKQFTDKGIIGGAVDKLLGEDSGKK